MAWPVTVSPLGSQGRRDEAAIEIARALAEISAPSALTDTSRILVVEPRSAQIARSLRAAGFLGELMALASVPIGERYGVADGYTTVVVDDWTANIAPQSRARTVSGAPIPPPETARPPAHAAMSVEGELDTVQSIIITDLTRYIAPEYVPAALRWLAGRLAVQGCLALADPALALEPEQLAELLNDTGLTLATDARVIEGDWPRTLTLWRRRSFGDATKGGVARRLTWEPLVTNDRLQELVVSAYQDVFGGEEWGEWVRCARPGANHAYSRAAAAALNPAGYCACGWPEPLVMYHSAEDVLARLYRDLTPATTSAAYFRFTSASDATSDAASIVQGNVESSVKGGVPVSLDPRQGVARSEAIDAVDGFSWGYLTDTYRLTRILRPEEEHAGPTRDHLQRQLLDLLSQLGARDNPSAIYYHAELGVREGVRSMSLTRVLFERGLRFAVERGARAVVLRTSKRSPVYRLLTGLGMRPIYWYEPEGETSSAQASEAVPDAALSRSDDRLLLAGDSQTLLDVFATISDTRLAVRIVRGLRAGQKQPC